MKSILWFVGGVAAVAFLYLVKNQASSSASEPVEELAHKLQGAWADHHTVV